MQNSTRKIKRRIGKHLRKAVIKKRCFCYFKVINVLLFMFFFLWRKKQVWSDFNLFVHRYCIVIIRFLTIIFRYFILSWLLQKIIIFANYANLINKYLLLKKTTVMIKTFVNCLTVRMNNFFNLFINKEPNSPKISTYIFFSLF